MGKTQKTDTGDLFPQTKKNTKGKSVFNVRALLEKKFHTIFDNKKAVDHPETPKWKEILGDLDGRCKMIIYGRSGSGKSVFVLQLIQFLSEVYGKVGYSSWEEAVNKTIVERIRNFMRIDPKTNSVKDVWFYSRISFEDLCRRIEKNYLRVIVIDSVQYARFTKDQLQELDVRFAKRHLVIIMVSFGTSEGKTRGADELLHASDIKLYLHKGQLSVTNRYLSKPFKKQLFAPELSVEIDEPEEVKEPDLFTPNAAQDETPNQEA